MKKGILLTLFAALMMCFVACDPDDFGGGDNNNYSTLILGTWRVDLMSVNGQNMTPENMQLTFTNNGRGLMNDGGETEHNDFGWVINGNTITVTTNHDQMNFTINTLTSTECSFTGDHMEMDGHEITGTILFHMVKVNGGDQPEPDPANFPVGTIWQFEYNTSMTEEGVTYDVSLSMRLHFNTGNEGILTTSEEASMMGQVLYSESQDEAFTYTYNASTASGTMTVTETNPETGMQESSTVTFTYNASTNTIVVINPDPDPNDPLGNEIVFTRVN